MEPWLQNTSWGFKYQYWLAQQKHHWEIWLKHPRAEQWSQLRHLKKKNLCSSHRQALLTLCSQNLPVVSFTERAVSEEVARPMHSAPAIVYHHSCQKNSLIFLRQVIIEHNLQNNSKAVVYMLDTSWMRSHLKGKPSTYWGCRTLSLQSGYGTGPLVTHTSDKVARRHLCQGKRPK